MKYKRFVVFDTETTGLQPDDCQIIEFAALVLDENAKVVDKELFCVNSRTCLFGYDTMVCLNTEIEALT